MNELALFAGAGGGILGGGLLGWRTVCAVEIDPYAAGVLVARQNDGLLPPFPVWDDVRTFDGHAWRGAVDVVSGGFPCQDISVAGKGAGIDGARSGLWSEMARIIGEVRPPFAFVENSPALLVRGFERVLGDLAALGYDCRWTVLGAGDIGAPHQRDRLWLLARDAGGDGTEALDGLPEGTTAQCAGIRGAVSDADGLDERIDHAGPWGGRSQPAAGAQHPLADTARLQPERSQQRTERQRTGARRQSEPAPADADSAQREGDGIAGRLRAQHADIGDARWWLAEPDVGRVADGVAARMDRLKAIGNGQVPLCAATAWKRLIATFDTVNGALH